MRRLRALLPEVLKKFMSERFDKEYNGAVGVLSSLRIDGTPNASPKHFRVKDDDHLEFTDVFSQTLRDVLTKTPDVTVVFFDPKAVIGFRLKGKASLETFGPLFQQAASQLENMGFKPKAVVSIKIDEAQSLSYGPNTGKKIG
ncbi:MAG: pyridoxamine 5'-phosphate oxidase family protein [Candidatus Bathyarchaeia archaeon]